MVNSGPIVTLERIGSQQSRRLCQKTGTLAGTTDVAVNFAKFID
jgi:hypothetical protein